MPHQWHINDTSMAHWRSKTAARPGLGPETPTPATSAMAAPPHLVLSHVGQVVVSQDVVWRESNGLFVTRCRLVQLAQFLERNPCAACQGLPEDTIMVEHAGDILWRCVHYTRHITISSHHSHHQSPVEAQDETKHVPHPIHDTLLCRPNFPEEIMLGGNPRLARASPVNW